MAEYLVTLDLRVTAASSDQAVTKAEDVLAELLEDRPQLRWYMRTTLKDESFAINAFRSLMNEEPTVAVEDCRPYYEHNTDYDCP